MVRLVAPEVATRAVLSLAVKKELVAELSWRGFECVAPEGFGCIGIAGAGGIWPPKPIN